MKSHNDLQSKIQQLELQIEVRKALIHSYNNLLTKTVKTELEIKKLEKQNLLTILQIETLKWVLE